MLSRTQLHLRLSLVHCILLTLQIGFGFLLVFVFSYGMAQLTQVMGWPFVWMQVLTYGLSLVLFASYMMWTIRDDDDVHTRY